MNKELGDIVNDEGEDAKDAAKVEEYEKICKQTVANIKVPIHDTL